MAEENVDPHDINFRQLLPWTELFRGFQVALDPKKLLLAALGILVMSLGWWGLALAFYSARHKPVVSDYDLSTYQKEGESEADAKRTLDAAYQSDLAKWKILDRAAGPDGDLNTWPWKEQRGPNPYLLVTGQAGPDWELSHFGTWFPSQVPFLIEPLVKFLRPVKYLLEPQAGFWNYLYFMLVLLWTLATWALFGGAITRMAAVQLTRREKITVWEALRFARSRYLSFFASPLFPLLFVLGILALLIVFGLFHLIPVVGEVVVDGIGWPLVILGCLVMAAFLVGLVGWPMMYATISVEGTDSFDALSRLYSYVYQGPWYYLWNSAVAILYGAALVFFVGFMGSLTAYLGKWSISQTPFSGARWTGRDPVFLFVYAPESYDWRTLLLDGAQVDGQNVVEHGKINKDAYSKYVGADEKYEGKDQLTMSRKIGAGMVSFWLTLFFLMMIGFGYSYFWTASTIIYLLMRRQVDDTDLDEVYLEEDESEDVYSGALPPASAGPPPAGAALTMVEAPTLRSPQPPPEPAAPPAKAESSAPAAGDGGPPP